MTGFFLAIYDYLSRHRGVMWGSLAASVVVMLLLAFNLRIHTDINDFMPELSNGDNEVIASLKVKDRIIVMFSALTDEADEERLSEAADMFEAELWSRSDSAHVLRLMSHADMTMFGRTVGFIYDNLPLYIDSIDYVRLDSLLDMDVANAHMSDLYGQMHTTSGMAMSGLLMRDPFGLATPLVSSLAGFGQFDEFALYNDRFVSADGRTMFLFIDSRDGGAPSPLNDELTTAIEESLASTGGRFNDVEPGCYGVPVISTYNARRIRRDLNVTLTVALFVITILILVSFRQKRTLPLLLLPVAYGALMASALIYLIQQQISGIAIGTGAVVLGVALSYSVHILSHAEHCSSPRQIIEDLAYPFTIGSITTIGAFVGLCLTSSPLLRDFGLLASLCLIGTTLFCLIFMPHFMRVDVRGAKCGAMRLIDRINGYRYDRNIWLVVAVCLAFAVGLFKWRDVNCDFDVMHIYYHPDHMEAAGQHLMQRPDEDRSVLLVSHSLSADEALKKYGAVDSIVASHKEKGGVERYMSSVAYLPSDSLQDVRLARWNNYWTDAKRKAVIDMLEAASVEAGFRPGTFTRFKRMLDRNYGKCDVIGESIERDLIFATLIEQCDAGTSLMTQVWIDDESKPELYSSIDGNAAIVDQSYFISEVAGDILDDYNFILAISSALVFVVLLVSYRSLELAILAFIPMCVSWFIILGFMALFGIEFNVVNIILSTFIFGIGDDFSIFVLDGLCAGYRSGQKSLSSHKTAIFFSSVMTVIGMGALLFARHPAIHSLALVSLLGMIVVVVVSYVLQPLLFRLLFERRNRNINWPFTFIDALRSLCVISLIALIQVMIVAASVVILVFPMGKRRKRRAIHHLIHNLMKLPLHLSPGCSVRFDQNGVDMSKPAIFVANHASMIDIIFMMSQIRDLVIVCQDWVWKSPVFGVIVRAAGYIRVTQGEEAIVDAITDAISDGSSVLIFPEGTRSVDLRVHRFHKGAFYAAEQKQLDIVPVVIYGSGCIYRKHDWLTVKPGNAFVRFLPRITPDDESFGTGYRERTRNVRDLIEDEYRKLVLEYGPENRYTAQCVERCYRYKQFPASCMRALRRNAPVWSSLNASLPVAGDILVRDGEWCDMSLSIAFFSPYRRVYVVAVDKEMCNFVERCGIDNISVVSADEAAARSFDAVVDYNLQISGSK